jgi:hypothetical protein
VWNLNLGVESGCGIKVWDQGVGSGCGIRVWNLSVGAGAGISCSEMYHGQDSGSPTPYFGTLYLTVSVRKTNIRAFITINALLSKQYSFIYNLKLFF